VRSDRGWTAGLSGFIRPRSGAAWAFGNGGIRWRGFPGDRHYGSLWKRADRLQHLAGVWPHGPLLVVHVGDDRQANEQRGLVRIVVGQLDAYGQPLDDLHEVAGGVLRREQGDGLTGPHGEAGDAALVFAPAPVHVHLAAHAMADAQVPELRLLEVGIDPDLGGRPDGQDALPRRGVIAGVDVAAGHQAIDLAGDVAITEVQLRLGEVAPGLEEPGLGLPDRRRLRHDPLHDAVDVSLLVAAGEFIEGLPGRLGKG